jgi:hypothetical protein
MPFDFSKTVHAGLLIVLPVPIASFGRRANTGPLRIPSRYFRRNVSGFCRILPDEQRQVLAEQMRIRLGDLGFCCFKPHRTTDAVSGFPRKETARFYRRSDPTTLFGQTLGVHG